MSTKGKSRRAFLLQSATGLSAAWVSANYNGILAAQNHVQKAVKAGQLPALTFFTAAQAAEVDAIVAQIIPADETPGAKEAHCTYFIDKALSGFARSSQDVYTKGLEDLAAKAGGKFSALPGDRQIALLTEIEKTSFFRAIRTHTVLGFFSRPIHGGNYDKAGWKLIGYDDSLNFKPPFGYYDAEYMKSAKA